MKIQTVVFSLIVLFVLLLITGCQKENNALQQETTTSLQITTTQPLANQDYVFFKDGKVRYGILVEKPSPCYKAAIKPSFLGTVLYLDVLLQAPSPGKICAQVITPEFVQGEVITGGKPAKAVVRKNNKELKTLIIQEE